MARTLLFPKSWTNLLSLSKYHSYCSSSSPSSSQFSKTTMARTKQAACKNASPCTPPSSSSSYKSIERSPSPPPRPTPPHTSSAFPSSNTSQEVLNLIPLSTFLPPLYTRPTPNFAQVPPHLRTRITPPRCSMRVQSGIGTSKSMNPKPHYFIISDSESDDSSDSCPPPTNQKESLSQPKPQTKIMKTKITMTIAQFLARKNLPNP
uniref:Uncharacterized protein PB18E9.04c-like n=1 Tax=Cicer arietinum TaxID=3827 RepID=A0A1S2Z213_CICAR|nr:uncharacterized protein PB18E9.04c-like [Cicer arietinum]